MMKKLLSLLMLVSCSLVAYNQATKLPLGESTVPPSQYPIGVYLMQSETNAPYNWRYDAGVVFGFKPVNSNYRHIQMIANSNGKRLSLRSKDGTNDGWTPWKKVIIDDGNGNISFSTGNHINFGQDYSKIFGNSSDQLIMQGHNGIALQSYHGPSQTLHTDLFAQYGKVGIGTTNPSEKLDVDGNIEMSGNNRYMRTHHWNYLGSAGSGYGYFGMSLRYRNDQWESFHSSINGMALRFIGNGMEFITAPPNTTPASITSLMTIKSSGNVAVQGKLEAQEIKVLNAPTADFVFENDYQLRPLNEVENYVKTNKHLPDIPSGKEIEKQGLDVGEMNARLLQKVEELTLYMIEQNKQNEAMQEKVEKLENEVSALKNE